MMGISTRQAVRTVGAASSWRWAKLRRLPPTLLVGALIVSVYVLVALTGRHWAPYAYNESRLAPPFAPMSKEHWFGTDQLGRDVFSRVVHGAGPVLLLSLGSTLLALILGSSIGLLTGLVGGWFDEGVMRFFEVLISIPTLIFALLLISAAGPEVGGNPLLLIAVVALVYLPRTSRMTRAVARDLVKRDFITAARTRGESHWSIVWRELAPNAIGVMAVEFGVRAGAAPVFIGSLGFLGFGLRPPTPEWGAMINENRVAILIAPWVVLAPALVLAGLVVGLNLFADGLARYLGRTAQRGGNL